MANLSNQELISANRNITKLSTERKITLILSIEFKDMSEVAQIIVYKKIKKYYKVSL